MIVQVFNKDILQVLTIFAISPGSKFVRKDLKDKTRLNNVNLDNVINILINAKLIRKEKRFLSLNLDNAKLIVSLINGHYKSLKGLPLDIYFSIIEIIFSLSKYKNINAYLFGSYAKLIFRKGSDIDIAIITNEYNEIKNKLDKLVHKLELKYKNSIEIHYFTEKFYKNRRDPIVKEILKNGEKLL